VWQKKPGAMPGFFMSATSQLVMVVLAIAGSIFRDSRR
jgi:hypothetical protein